ncbi:hypothetical protein HPG69_017538 [Diceros bicornis minor]|uniref:Tudor domain-containing protein n=1 Tax=Diceros bicornis minor TaxID=77932 RepID=A0A7J7EKZ9_DICBM|nr:hypothetical protein HPG69_017538 [Diceros bicornis minor]
MAGCTRPCGDRVTGRARSRSPPSEGSADAHVVVGVARASRGLLRQRARFSAFSPDSPTRWGHHHELQCGHDFCELCLLITEEYNTVVCPGCEETKTAEEIDEALKIAGYNSEQLSIAVKVEIMSNFYISLEERKKVDLPVLTNEAPPTPLQRKTNYVRLEAKNTQPQKEVVATMSSKTIAALPQVGSSPDVIIEEIIEENLESSPELVFVSHVIDPCHFYIRKYSQIKDATVLEKEVNQFCSKSSHLDPSDILEIGARVFVNSIENGMWCRGTITELIPIESENIRKLCSPTKFSVREVALIQIFLVDFGNSEVLIVAGVGDTHVRAEHIAEQHIVLNDLCLVLRKSELYIEGLLKDIQPLAQPCSLKDIVPQNSFLIYNFIIFEGLPGHREVEVKYVDFGNTAKITLNEMRKIKDEFLNPPEKAIKCKLAYIEPCKRTMQWSKKAKEKFEEKTQDKFMTCSVIKILEDNVLLVELFDSLGVPGMTPTSINDLLVKEGLASYEVGYTLKDNSRKHIEVWDPSPEEIISNEVNNLNPVSEKCLPNENLQSLYNKELPVHICNVISPEKIYVQWLLTENLLNRYNI